MSEITENSSDDNMQVESDNHIGFLVEVPGGMNPRLAGGTKRFQLFSRDGQTVLMQSDIYNKVIDSLAAGTCKKANEFNITDQTKITWDAFLQLKRDNMPQIAALAPASTLNREVRTVAYTPTVPVSQYSVSERYQMFGEFIEMFVEKSLRGLVIIGNRGLGKSTTVDRYFQDAGLLNKLETENKSGDYRIASGATSGPGLYRLLYENKDGLLVLDDCYLRDTECREYLKAVLDTKDTRWVTSNVVRSPDDPIPSFFKFTGSVMLIANTSEAEIRQALGERVPTLNMWMTEEEIMQFIETVIMPDMLSKDEFTVEAITDAFNLLKDHYKELPEFNLRTFGHLVGMRSSKPDRWQDLCKFSVLRRSFS